MVPKTFEKEIVCDVSTKPEPPKPQPEPTKPTPPIMKSRACIQLDMGCDASEKVLGKGCSAKYKLFGSTVEEKTPLVNSGNYCKDREATLKDLCGKNADTYSISCTKTP